MLILKPISSGIEDIAGLQVLLNSAPTYARIATGESVSQSAAIDMLEALPPGKQYKDKFVLGAYLNESLVGCVDLIRGYPTESNAYIGLLLISEEHEGHGYGAMIFTQICKLVEQWGTCKSIRLSVLESNIKAKLFWRKLGFQATGDFKPYQSGRVSTKVHIYERRLLAAA